MSRNRFAILSLSCCLAVVLSSASADARERRNARSQVPKGGQVERTVTRTGPNGRTATTHDELRRSESGYTRETVHTGPKGGVTTRNATGSYDAGAKTWTRDATTTRPDGSSTSTQVIRQVTPVTEPAGSAQ